MGMSLREFNRYIDKLLPPVDKLVLDPDENARTHIMYMALRLAEMFRYTNLPETMPQRYIEQYLLLKGHCGVISYEGKLYALQGGFGGEPDPWYLPIEYVISNPALNLSKIYQRSDVDGSIKFRRGENVVVLGNDKAYYGLYPLLAKYAHLLAANELSMYRADINTRAAFIISATSDDEKSSAEKYLSDLEAGKSGVIGSDQFFEGVKIQPMTQGGLASPLTSLIEYEQYLKASLYNELGLNANYNMKRESINSNESQLNDDMLTPLIDDMLEARREGVEQINEMFGTDITVDFNSAWKENEITTMLEMGGLKDGGEGLLQSDVDASDSPDSGISEDQTVAGSEAEEASEVFPEPMEESEEGVGEGAAEEEQKLDSIEEKVDSILEEVEEIQEELTGEEGADEKND